MPPNTRKGGAFGRKAGSRKTHERQGIILVGRAGATGFSAGEIEILDNAMDYTCGSAERIVSVMNPAIYVVEKNIPGGFDATMASWSGENDSFTPHPTSSARAYLE